MPTREMASSKPAMGARHPHFIRQSFHIFHLVFIWLYHEKLKNDKWGFAFQFLFPFHNIFCSLKYLVKSATNTILFIYFLCCAIN